jgi:hypothetical protein
MVNRIKKVWLSKYSGCRRKVIKNTAPRKKIHQFFAGMTPLFSFWSFRLSQQPMPWPAMIPGRAKWPTGPDKCRQGWRRVFSSAKTLPQIQEKGCYATKVGGVPKLLKYRG